MAGGTLRVRGTVRHVREVAMRGQLTAMVIAGAMLTAGLGTSAAASAATTPPLAITTTGEPCAGGVCSLAKGNVGADFEATVVATGGAPSQNGVDSPYTWAITSGSLPAGLTFDNEYGEFVLSGTPTKAGIEFVYRAGDRHGRRRNCKPGVYHRDRHRQPRPGDHHHGRVLQNASYHQNLQIVASDANTSVTLTASVTSTGQKIGLVEDPPSASSKAILRHDRRPSTARSRARSPSRAAWEELPRAPSPCVRAQGIARA